MKKNLHEPRVIIIYGSSQSGKSFFAQEIQKQLNEQGFDVHFTPRYYTRQKRDGAQEDENSIFNQEIDEKDFDIIVNIYGNKVGTKISEVKKMLESGTTPIFLTTERKNVTRMLNFFPNALTFKTLMKSPLTIADYLAKEKERNPQLSDEENFDSAKRRFVLYKEVEQDNEGVQNLILNPFERNSRNEEVQQQTALLVEGVCEKIKKDTRKKSIIEIGKEKVLKMIENTKKSVTGIMGKD